MLTNEPTDHYIETSLFVKTRFLLVPIQFKNVLHVPSPFLRPILGESRIWSGGREDEEGLVEN